MKTIRGTGKVRPMVAAGLLISAIACSADDQGTTGLADSLMVAAAMSPALVSEGREIFRFDTFGDEALWTDVLQMHLKINALKPIDAIAAGLKIDIDAPELPAAVRQQLINGTADLEDPGVTVALIGFDAVLGVKGEVENGVLVRVGITCALCHSTVDGPVAGRRLDGWPNRDLNVGAIIAMSDVIPDAPYNTWGPGMYDPRFNQNLDKPSVPVVLPPAFGLRHVKKETYTGDDVVSYWNAYVAITQMGGRGFFSDPRIGVTVDNTPPDLVSSKLPALLAYQLSLDTPQPKAGTYNAAAAARGKIVFTTTAGCARCHLGTIYSDINANRLYTADEVGQDGEYATRSVTKLYRTTPLRGLWNPPQLDGPYFHDGSAPTLAAVVEHYVGHFNLSLTAQQKSDLVEYLKTL
jgi:mono/diheme cytochrome c family protein